ncbi:3-hydroxyacyl-ACP dehydratase FabZ family protein [Limnoglobus roseus]|uniref:3-hydroxyacyl-[acyl-carrier-protein] dehydratase FabZ n=1 Tax=Limnoglobus roseus TaxID=2598579 RepID=A0A5C1AN32_9BACT|nr:3-hydroxyacyl-ACP dehydratase FabZ family protein [Limnoglobus roseus]QEL20390.1 3-hydroxyacyl-[acyl-carrier-protein] dehydratase FabZ [Limnoglobus roseus]
MPVENPLVDLAALDFTRPLVDRDGVLALNPHRGAMVLLDGIVSIDGERKVIVGYKDVTADEFWASGHFPNFPVMPGVLMCEAAAQLTSFYMYQQKIVAADRLVGLGGIEETRFREPVRPGDRLILVGLGRRTAPRLTRFEVKGYVSRAGTFESVFETTIMGVTLGTLKDLIGA